MNRLVLCNLLAMTLCTCQSPQDQRVDGGSNDATVTDTDVNPQMPSSPEVSEDDEHRASGSLIHPFDWRVTPHDVDPFDELISSGEERDVQCEGDAHGVEEVSPGVWSYSVETERCHWITLQQPTRRAARAGDLIKLKVWHFELNAPQPAFAQVGLATDAELLTIAEVPIPSAGAMLKLEGTLTRDLPIGSDLYFHLDNHGANSWHVLEVKLLLNEED